MSLEDAAYKFFLAIRETATGVLGHDKYSFRLDLAFGARVEETEEAKTISAMVQAAMNNAASKIIAKVSQ